MSTSSLILRKLFEHLIMIKMFHFQTSSGFRHLKVDDHMTVFLEKLDRFFEVWQGEFGKLKETEIPLGTIKMAKDETFHAHLDNFATFLMEIKDSKLGDATCGGVLDDIVGDVRKLQYLVKEFK